MHWQIHKTSLSWRKISYVAIFSDFKSYIWIGLRKNELKQVKYKNDPKSFSFWTKIHFLTFSSDFVSIMTNRFMNNILIFIKISTNFVFAYSDDPYKGCSMSVLQITLEMYFSSHFIYSTLDSIIFEKK